MKKFPFGIIAILLITFFYACKKNDFPPFFKENCQVIGQNVVNEGVGESDYSKNYMYDKNGYIISASTTVTTIQAGIGEIKFTNRYDYTRDNNGRTISMENNYSDNQGNNSKNAIKVIYDTKGKKIEHLIEYLGQEPFIQHTIKYNGRGLISEYTSEYMSPDLSAYNQKRFFEYNSIGQLSKSTLADGTGITINYSLFEPEGIIPSNEAYLIEHGLLPVDLIFNNIYTLVDGGVGSVEKIYTVMDDQNTVRNSILSPINIKKVSGGKIWSMSLPAASAKSMQKTGTHNVLAATITTKSVTLNQRGFPGSRVFEVIILNAGNNYNVNENYQFDCSGYWKK